MKKKLTPILSVICVLLCAVFCVAGCGVFATVPDDRLPYDVALEGGYEGTLEAWLEEQYGVSSRERQWYNELVASGEFEGSFAQFLAYIAAEDSDGSYAANRALLSVVSIYAFHSDKYSMGSGVVYKLDGDNDEAIVITNYHVLHSTSTGALSEDIVVYAYGNETYSMGQRGDGALAATYIGGSVKQDLALLKVSYTALSTLLPVVREAEWGNSDGVTVGDTAFAVGNAAGKGLTVTRGIVSVDYEVITAFAGDGKTPVSYPEIRTDAAVNHGNSGGGLFNTQGQIIGLVNARSEVANDTTVTGIGYAFPADFVRAVVDNILDNGGRLKLAQSGFKTEVREQQIVYDETTGRIYRQEKIIAQATAAGPSAGADAGIRNGDTFISATLMRGGQAAERRVEFTRAYRFETLFYRVRKGDTIEFVVSREGETLTFEAEYDKDNYFVLVP